MKLFTNGCSFTHGHKEYKNNRKDAPDWVWPSIVAENFDDHVNLAWMGGSNDRILRTTLEFFNSIKDKKDWVAVIQWSDCFNRAELYDPETDTYFGYIGGSGYTPVLDQTTNTKFVELPKPLYRIAEIYEKSIITRPDRILEDKLAQQQFLLAHFFKEHNINFLYTGMAANSLVSPDSISHIAKHLPYHNILPPLSIFANSDSLKFIESETDFHPNKAGHRVIANYITNELRARNYI